MVRGGLGQIDLNLFVTLDAVVRDGSVRGAAVRLGVTQSAVSHALRRLRDQLGDPLVVRTPQGMRPTPRAERIAATLRRCLGELDAVVRDPGEFVPGSACRSFTLAASDAAEFVLLPALMQALQRDAPGVDLVVRAESTATLAAVAEGELDLAVGVFTGAPGPLRTQPLYRQAFVCVVRKDHPQVRRGLTLARYLELSHVSVAPRGTAGSLVDDALARLGARRRVALVVPHFLVAPMIVAETDLALMLPERLARRWAEILPLRLVAPPLELADFTVSQVWSERAHLDAGHAWLRQTLARVARGL